MYFVISGDSTTPTPLANGQHSQQFIWGYVQNEAPEVLEVSTQPNSMPRVKLTGTGKMPVVDMRSKNNLSSGHPTVSGLPPKSPVYALVNKTGKKKLNSPVTSPTRPKNPIPDQVHMHNYCNVSPLLGDIIKKPEIFSQVQPNQVYASINKNPEPVMTQNQNGSKHDYENTKPLLQIMGKSFEQDNYLPMGPSNEDDLPIRPFDPMDYRNLKKIEDDPIDHISLRLQVN